jgi:hypothetical protein
MRADVFRFAPESGHRAMQSACLFGAKIGSRHPYSMTSLAHATISGGIASPRDLAALRLITSSNCNFRFAPTPAASSSGDGLHFTATNLKVNERNITPDACFEAGFPPETHSSSSAVSSRTCFAISCSTCFRLVIARAPFDLRLKNLGSPFLPVTARMAVTYITNSLPGELLYLILRHPCRCCSTHIRIAYSSGFRSRQALSATVP